MQRDVEHRFVARGIDPVAHFVAVEAAAEQRAHEPRREAAQREVEHRRIALAQVLGVPSALTTAGDDGADVGMRVEPAHRVGERVRRELDVRIEHQMVVGARCRAAPGCARRRSRCSRGRADT